MRLRYMRLPQLKPLEDIAIHFGYEPVLGRACAVHFIVGVNGSGKSRLLRALAEIFLCMERGTAIPFSVTLVYDLGPDTGDEYAKEADTGNVALAQARHTIYLHRPQQGHTLLADFDYIGPVLSGEQHDWDALAESDWEHFDHADYKLRAYYRGDNLPSVYLPRVLLAYTSGATEEWEALFASQGSTSQDIIVTTFNNLQREQERPFHWNTFKETERLYQQGLEPSTEEEDEAASLDVEYTTSSMGVFVPPHALKFALCVVALDQAAEDFAQMPDAESEQRFRTKIDMLLAEGRRMRGLRGILNEVDWLWPVTIGLHIAFRPEHFSQAHVRQLLRLYEAATTVIREPGPGTGRRLFFDLRAMQKDKDGRDITTAQALINALTPLGDDTVTIFGMFKQLLMLQQLGIVEDITIALKKRTLDDVLLYDWLSDGERVFLGRMAFFHLLQKTDDALILLDEAETHFNDYWKRELVDIIDSSLRDDTIEVLLSTHSSIALTDAFDTEIVLLAKDPSDGSISVEEIPIKSFGASPVDIMRNIFHAPETVGQRAAEFLDLMLMIDLYRNEVQAVWALDTPGTTRKQLEDKAEFRTLKALVSQRLPRALHKDEDPEEQINILLVRMLRSVHRYTQQITGKTEVTWADALDALQQRLGPGYYNFEFRRRLQTLRRDLNAASN